MSRNRHFAYYLEFVKTAHIEVAVPRRRAGWLARLDADNDNLRTALTWGSEHDPRAALCLALAVAAMVPSSAAARQVTSTVLRRTVLLVTVDPVTDDRAHVECDAPSDSFASDVLLVDANDFPTVAQRCNVAAAPVVGP